MRTEPGSSALTAGRRSRTLFATSTALAPAWRLTARMTVAEGTAYPRTPRTEEERARGAVELARSARAGPSPDRLGEVVHRDAPRPEGGRIRLDPDGRLRPEDVHAGDAAEDADALGDLGARVVVEPA